MKSERHQLANRLAEHVRTHRMTNPFGGDVSRNGRYYAVAFAKPRVLDGVIRIYSPKFILIECRGPLVRGDHSGVYESEANATAFLNALGAAEIDQAMAVPTKARTNV